MPPQAIAVLGGGITGLSAVFHLSRRFPGARITLFEKSDRLGGWINSRHAKVSDNVGHSAMMCLEAGPRTLRPNSKAILELIHKLHLKSEIISTSRSHPAAKNRFLHIPGQHGLVTLPSSPLSLLSSPFLASLIAVPAAKEMFRYAKTISPAEDESVDSFLSRHFGERFARILGSALVHGIYAADSRILSVRAAFPSLWDAEARGNGSIVRGFLRSQTSSSASIPHQYDVGDLTERMKDVSAYSFRGGMESLPRAIVANIQAKQNVTIRLGESITRICSCEEQPGTEVQVELSTGETNRFSHVVSTVSLPKLQSITPNNSLPHLTRNPMSTVTVVNIVFPPAKISIHPPGFGYLIPRPDVKSETDPSGFLGSVFDSSALGEQDSGDAGFTKLTVMMGGPHTLKQGQTEPAHVLAHLAEHLQRTEALPEPVLFERREQIDCIPTPVVGHIQRMDELQRVLRDPAGPWKGRLEVIGAGVGGVSVGDCVEAGRAVGSAWE